ncbi:hypothetical protein EDB86DRAFT_3245007 [Lactarius hatsudake]|nr:hypothetical protein EDB86DRAFT_3245007 [Lactarius hatsudake]
MSQRVTDTAISRRLGRPGKITRKMHNSKAEIQEPHQPGCRRNLESHWGEVASHHGSAVLLTGTLKGTRFLVPGRASHDVCDPLPKRESLRHPSHTTLSMARRAVPAVASSNATRKFTGICAKQGTGDHSCCITTAQAVMGRVGISEVEPVPFLSEPMSGLMAPGTPSTEARGKTS